MRKIRRRVPVEDYLKPQKRFAHLFGSKADGQSLKQIQAIADENIAAYGLLEKSE